MIVGDDFKYSLGFCFAYDTFPLQNDIATEFELLSLHVATISQDSRYEYLFVTEMKNCKNILFYQYAFNDMIGRVVYFWSWDLEPFTKHDIILFNKFSSPDT